MAMASSLARAGRALLGAAGRRPGGGPRPAVRARAYGAAAPAGAVAGVLDGALRGEGALPKVRGPRQQPAAGCLCPC